MNKKTKLQQSKDRLDSKLQNLECLQQAVDD